jgi:hypothetical protein
MQNEGLGIMSEYLNVLCNAQLGWLGSAGLTATSFDMVEIFRCLSLWGGYSRERKIFYTLEFLTECPIGYQSHTAPKHGDIIPVPMLVAALQLNFSRLQCFNFHQFDLFFVTAYYHISIVVTSPSSPSKPPGTSSVSSRQPC